MSQFKTESWMNRNAKMKHPRSWIDVIENFWSKVDKTGDCWLWMGCIGTKGYGQYGFMGKIESTHRISFIIYNRIIIPKRFLVCHDCDTKLCVRPIHLYLCSNSENILKAYNTGSYEGEVNERLSDKYRRDRPTRTFLLEEVNQRQHQQFEQDCVHDSSGLPPQPNPQLPENPESAA
jgi:uncharacterized protein YlaI